MLIYTHKLYKQKILETRPTFRHYVIAFGIYKRTEQQNSDYFQTIHFIYVRKITCF